MSALSQSLTFNQFTTSTAEVIYPVTATTTMIYTSSRTKGDGYYGSSDGLHTVSYVAAPTFIGTITVQASLATEPTEADWFFVPGTTSTYTLFNERDDFTIDYY